MLTAKQILELKHHANEEVRRVYEAFKEKILDDPQGHSVLQCFGDDIFDIYPFMEIYVSNILSSNEFIYMVDTFPKVSNACIQAFIDGMTLDEADWAVTIFKGCNHLTLENIFYLITHGYSNEQIKTFAEEQCKGNLEWYATDLNDVVIGYPKISVEEIKCCANLVRTQRVIPSNRNLFITLLKMGVDTSELEAVFSEVNTWEYKAEEIIEVFSDFKLLYGN